jgi:hypothetical protein
VGFRESGKRKRAPCRVRVRKGVRPVGPPDRIISDCHPSGVTLGKQIAPMADKYLGSIFSTPPHCVVTIGYEPTLALYTQPRPPTQRCMSSALATATPSGGAPRSCFISFASRRCRTPPPAT